MEKHAPNQPATRSNNIWVIAGAIIVAGLIIAGAVVYAVSGNSDGTASNAAQNTERSERDGNADAPYADESITEEDHLRGNPDAPIVIIEYSDTECPFCQRFHNTMKQVMDEYGGPDGQVAWVYRHFPIPQLHSKAPKEARATECAASLGGEEAFWTYIDTIFEETPSNNRLDHSRLPDFAEQAGVDRSAFMQCLESGKFKDKVEAHQKLAREAGGRGTPYSVGVVRGGENFAISGAQPFSRVKQKIEAALDGLQ